MQLFSSSDFNPKVGIGKAVIKKEFFWIRTYDQICKFLVVSLSVLGFDEDWGPLLESPSNLPDPISIILLNVFSPITQ